MFKTHHELIKILEDRGIAIEPNDIQLLEENGYSFLIHNFGKALSDVNGNYGGVKLKDIVFLSEIDSKISTFFWRKISKIEKMLKVAFINAVGAVYGSHALLDNSIFTIKKGGINDAPEIVQKIISKQIENGCSKDESELLWNITNATMLYELAYIINLMPIDIYDEIMDRVGYETTTTNKRKRRTRFRSSVILIRQFRNLIAHQIPIINGVKEDIHNTKEVFDLFTAFEKFKGYENIRERVYIHFDDEDSDNSKVHGILNKHFGLRFTEKDLPIKSDEINFESDSGKTKQKNIEKKIEGETND